MVVLFKEYKLLFLLDVLFQETIWNVRLFHRHPILVCYTSLNHQVNWMKRESREKKKGFHGCTAPKDMERIIRVLLVRQGCKMKNSFIILFFIFGCWIIINKIWFELFIFISSKKGWKTTFRIHCKNVIFHWIMKNGLSHDNNHRKIYQ